MHAAKQIFGIVVVGLWFGWEVLCALVRTLLIGRPVLVEVEEEA